MCRSDAGEQRKVTRLGELCAVNGVSACCDGYVGRLLGRAAGNVVRVFPTWTRVAGLRTHPPGPAARASRRSTPSREQRCARRARLACGGCAARQSQAARVKTV